MVSKVLAWRAKKPEEANAVWERINKANTKIWALFAELDAIAAEDLAAYEKDLAMAAAQPLASLEKSTPTLSALADVFATCQALRADLRLMSSLADVPVEPPEQTVLLDATMACNGVVAAAVPGAGGMDAIYAVAIAGDAEKGVERMWQSRGGVCAMLSREGKGGARVEAVEDVKGLVDQLQGL